MNCHHKGWSIKEGCPYRQIVTANERITELEAELEGWKNSRGDWVTERDIMQERITELEEAVALVDRSFTASEVKRHDLEAEREMTLGDVFKQVRKQTAERCAEIATQWLFDQGTVRHGTYDTELCNIQVDEIEYLASEIRKEFDL